MRQRYYYIWGEREREESGGRSSSLFGKKSRSPPHKIKIKIDRTSFTRNSCVKMLIFRINADDSNNSNNKKFAHHYGGSFSIFFSLLSISWFFIFATQTMQKQPRRKKPLIQKLDGLMMLYFTSIWCLCCWLLPLLLSI